MCGDDGWHMNKLKRNWKNGFCCTNLSNIESFALKICIWYLDAWVITHTCMHVLYTHTHTHTCICECVWGLSECLLECGCVCQRCFYISIYIDGSEKTNTDIYHRCLLQILIIDIYYRYLLFGGTRGVIVIVVGNGHEFKS